MEFRALRTLAENRGRTITRGQILAATHEEHTDATERSVDVLIVGLRRKLRARSAMIETIHGVGYRLAPDAECPAGPETRSPR
jgi:two-component system phosphate regulon response regulator PhoB